MFNPYAQQQYEDNDVFGLDFTPPPPPPAAPPVPQGIAGLDIGKQAPQVRPDPVQTPQTAPSGHYERVGSGEDAYDQWVSDVPQAQPYAGSNTDMAFWASRGKMGYTGQNPYVYNQTTDEGGTRQDIAGTSKEFDEWLAQNPGFTTKTVRDGDKGTQYLLDAKGNVVDSADVDFGHVGFLDKLAAAMPAIIVGLGTGGLGALASGALAGAAAPAMKGFVEGQNLGDVLKTAGKGAALGALGGAASGYINPAAAELGKSVGGGTLGDIVSGAASGAGRSLVGSALTGGKNLGQNILTGALGGAANTAANAALGEAAGAAGISPDVLKVIAPTAMAALTGKDWKTAGLTSLIGAAAQDAAQQAALEKQAYESKTDTGDETDRLLKRYPGQEESTQQLIGGSPLTAGMSAASIQPALDALKAAGQDVDLTDIGKMIGWKGDTTKTEPADVTDALGIEDADQQNLDDLITSMAGTKDEKEDPSDLLLQKMIDEGYGNRGQDFVVNDKNQIVDTAGNLDTLDTDVFPYDTFTGNAPEGESSGNLAEDFVVDENGNLRSTYTGEVGTFQDGKFVPTYTPPTQTKPTAPTTKSPGGSPTKPTTGTTPTTTSTTPSSPTGGMDINSLLALLALMGGSQQQAAPVQPLFQATGPKVSDIFKNWMA